MEEEVEQLILRAIIKYGYPAIPLDYAFLQKYNLKEIYFIGVENNVNGVRSYSYMCTLQTIIQPFLKDTGFPKLSALYDSYGKRGVLSHLHDSELYYKFFKSQLKNEFSKPIIT